MKASAPEEVEEKDAKKEITFDQFMETELKVAEVTEADRVKGADKLLRIQLDLGTESRQVVSGIAEFYEPEDLVGKQVLCVTNLKPVKLRGEISEGMILCGEDEKGKLTLATIETPLPNGSLVK